MFDFLSTGEVVIFTKINDKGNEDYSVLVMDRLTDNDVVGCSQTKTKMQQNHSYANPADADTEFMRAASFFVNNGWNVQYHGNRNEG